MYFDLPFWIISILSTAVVLGISLAIAGDGNRKAWLLALPVVTAAWSGVELLIRSLTGNEMAVMFWGLTLPVILCVTASYFRRWRERRRSAPST